MRQLKPFLVITGMHRGGTSFLARSLNLAGVYLGDLESLTTNDWQYHESNPRGHWENRNMLEISNKIFKHNNTDWDKIPEKITLNDDIISNVKNTFQNLENHASLASGFKDPRILLYFDELQPYFPSNTIVIGVFRNPLIVAESLKIRDGFSYEKSLGLWEHNNKKLLSVLEKNDGFLIDFDWPKEKLFSELKSIFKKLGLTEIDLSTWFSEDLKRSNKTFDENYVISDNLKSLYSLLKKRSENNSLVNFPEFHFSENKLRGIISSLNKEIQDQGSYFRKINEKNLNFIKLEKENEPMGFLIRRYFERPDLQKKFPEVFDGNFKGLLHWVLTLINSKPKGEEKLVSDIQKYAEWYKNYENFVKNSFIEEKTMMEKKMHLLKK